MGAPLSYGALFSKPLATALKMDLLNTYFKGCSPYILELEYNLEKRKIIIICARDTIDWKPGKRLTFSDVTEFSESVVDEDDFIDDTLIDSMMGLYPKTDGTYVLCTEKRELFFKSGTDPISVDIDK